MKHIDYAKCMLLPTEAYQGQIKDNNKKYIMYVQYTSMYVQDTIVYAQDNYRVRTR